MAVSITDVRVLPGDAAFLLDDGKTAVLYDSGFAFTGYGVAKNIKNILGNRNLDYVLLTHSHYDHAAGSAYIRRCFPDVKVAASRYTATVFTRPGAIARMREMDRKAAIANGVREYEDLFDELRVDIPLSDGEVLACGDMLFTAIALPGHTKCSMGYYLFKEGLLLSSETLGVYFGNDRYLPSYLVGYGVTLDSFVRAEALAAKQILAPHYGILHDDVTKRFLVRSKEETVRMADYIISCYKEGKNQDEILFLIKEKMYTGDVAPAYPIDAFLLNTGIMIDLVIRELLLV